MVVSRVLDQFWKQNGVLSGRGTLKGWIDFA